MNDRVVQREARDIASDLRGRDGENGLSNAEAECLRELLGRSEAFSHLVRAQQVAVLVDQEMVGVDEGISAKAHDGAHQQGAAIDELVQHMVADTGMHPAVAEEIVAAADALGRTAREIERRHDD